MAKQNTTDLIKTIEDLYKNVPNLPKNAQEVLAKIAPILALVFGVLGILSGIFAVTASPIAALGGIRGGGMIFVTGILTIASSALLLSAYPKLKKNLYAGWTLLFWSECINVLSSLVSGIMVNPVSTLIGTIIGAAIGFYILFQIKSYFK
jgi:hypothetical protein